MSSDDETFGEMMNDALPDAIITNFVTIYEIATEHGMELSLSTSDTLTPWLASGMLDFAKEMILSGAHGVTSAAEYLDDEESEDG